jgi:hypothetical protein
VRRPLVLTAVLGLLGVLVLPGQAAAAAGPPTTTPIEHLVVMMQNDHSFDNYFGTYPGANGIPANTCLPLETETRSLDGCLAPFRMGNEPPEDLNRTEGVQRRQYDDGRMDGFVAAYRRIGRDGSTAMVLLEPRRRLHPVRQLLQLRAGGHSTQPLLLGGRGADPDWGRAAPGRGLRGHPDDLRPARRPRRAVEVLRREPRSRGRLPHGPRGHRARPAAGVRPVSRRPAPRGPRRGPVGVLRGPRRGHPPVGRLRGPQRIEREPPGPAGEGPGPGPQHDGGAGEERVLAELGVPSDLQRLGRVLRPCRPTDDR